MDAKNQIWVERHRQACSFLTAEPCLQAQLLIDFCGCFYIHFRIVWSHFIKREPGAGQVDQWVKLLPYGLMGEFDPWVHGRGRRELPFSHLHGVML